QASRLVLEIDVVEVSVRQFHDDDDFPLGSHLDQLVGEDEGMAHVLLDHAVERLALLFGAGPIDVEGVEAAEDELDGLLETAGGLALPDFAEPAAAERLDEAITGD